ncbi:MAG: alkane 1-monooxygenase [Chitinophagaceae bacterium]
MPVRMYKYGAPFVMYALALSSFFTNGFFVFVPLLYSWLLIPLAELVLKPDTRNLSAAEEDLARADKKYDYFLYAIVPLQYAALASFLYQVTYLPQPLVDIVGKTLVMGLLCGTFGINVGHELGHRANKFEQYLAKALLLTSLYLHFFIEHNKGHHKRVATPEDPSTARYGESVYRFYFRIMVYGYLSAWHIAARDARKKGFKAFSIRNEMLQYQLLQILFVITIGMVFSWTTALWFLAAALNGILLLETVNYIEHYGLQRKAITGVKWERALPQHSWNSNHVIGRVMLFELSRHSDHHYLASRKYQVLRHHDDSPQMPTGYPGMMLLALLPPAWFYVMHKRIKELQA